MFKRRKYKLKFTKTCQHISWGVWKEVSDASLMYFLLILQQKYDFDIVKTKFKGSFDTSYIMVKCNKGDNSKIFSEYCLKLDDKIENICF